MQYTVLPMLMLSFVGGALGQVRGPYWSLGGFGNVLYPGTGHAPQAAAPPGVSGRFSVLGHRVLASPPRASHSGQGPTSLLPYPVFYGSAYGYDGSDPSDISPPGYSEQPPVIDRPPPVIINQNFVPRQLNPQAGADAGVGVSGQPVADDKPTIYLIAFKDHSIIEALGYWMEGSTLHYVNAEHTLNQATLDLIDRELSQRLNVERGLEFKLPASR